MSVSSFSGAAGGSKLPRMTEHPAHIPAVDGPLSSAEDILAEVNDDDEQDELDDEKIEQGVGDE